MVKGRLHYIEADLEDDGAWLPWDDVHHFLLLWERK